MSKNINGLLFLLNNSNVSVLALTETWLQPAVDTSSLLGDWCKEYDVFRCDRNLKKGGGVAILARRTLCPREIFMESVTMGYELLCIDTAMEGVTVRWVVVYRTPACLATSSDQLWKALGDLLSCNHPCIICGDFNLPDIKWNETTLTRCDDHSSSAPKKFLELCCHYGLKQLVKGPTLGDNILDLVLTNADQLIFNVASECPIGNSDHGSVKFETVLNLPTEQTVIYKRNFKLADYDGIRAYLSNVDWFGSLSMADSISDKYELFLAILQHSIELFVPYVGVPLGKTRLPGYLVSLHKRKSLAWAAANANDDSERSEHWAKFREINKKFEDKLRKYNASIEKKVVESGNKREFFKYLSGRIQFKSRLGVLSGPGSYIARGDQEKAELLADTFEQVFSIPKDECCLQRQQSFPVMNDSFWCRREDILELLSKWPKSSSLTPDHIPLSFFQAVAEVIATPLEFIFNLSFMHAKVPRRWKMSYVTPLPKKPPYDCPKNFRPVSITSILARLFEKLLKKKIVNHLSDNCIISTNQHGFQKGRSTITAMLQCLNDWTSSVDKGNAVDVVYFDFAKAFDRVSHKLLLSRMYEVGIHPRIIAWIADFIDDRTFQVRVNSCYSRPRSVLSGVPQGCVLSPVLFNIFTYDLPKLACETGAKCCAFADDLKLYHVVSDSTSREALQNGIDAVASWSGRWGLPLSEEKSHVLHLGPRNARFSYNIGGVTVSSATSVRDLGFIVSEDLSFDSHCEYIATKATRLIYNIFRALSTRKHEVLLQAYKTYVRPVLEYGTVVFCPFKKKSISKLESVQNSFTRKLMIRSLGFSYDLIPDGATRNINFGLQY